LRTSIEEIGKFCSAGSALSGSVEFAYRLLTPTAPSHILAFATVLRGMLLQASDGHGHFIGQPPLLASRQLPRPP